jgi:hypothetical protein
MSMALRLADWQKRGYEAGERREAGEGCPALSLFPFGMFAKTGALLLPLYIAAEVIHQFSLFSEGRQF